MLPQILHKNCSAIMESGPFRLSIMSGSIRNVSTAFLMFASYFSLSKASISSSTTAITGDIGFGMSRSSMISESSDASSSSSPSSSWTSGSRLPYVGSIVGTSFSMSISTGYLDTSAYFFNSASSNCCLSASDAFILSPSWTLASSLLFPPPMNRQCKLLDIITLTFQ